METTTIITSISVLVAATSMIISAFSYKRNIAKNDEDKREEVLNDIIDLKIELSAIQERCQGRCKIYDSMSSQMDDKLDEIIKRL
jgi:hypothetical protein